jgi:NADH:ubiquinone oxidoreductase subunit D
MHTQNLAGLGLNIGPAHPLIHQGQGQLRIVTKNDGNAVKDNGSHHFTSR